LRGGQGQLAHGNSRNRPIVRCSPSPEAARLPGRRRRVSLKQPSPTRNHGAIGIG
jgi:hypothetical protein